MRPGRPPRRPTGDTSTLTVRIGSTDKNLLIDQADAFDMSITEYLVTLIRRDAGL